MGDAACLGSDGLPLGRDCDDTDPNRFPDNPEVCDADNHDEDCDATTFGYVDQDMDGYPDASCCNANPDGSLHCGTDCNDEAGGVHPGSPEVCDGIDNDCNGSVDDGVERTFYVDADGDGHGDASQPAIMGCFPPTGYAASSDDCDDSNAAAHPGAVEVCDAAMVDEDCDEVANPPALCTCTGSATRSCLAPGACSAGVERCSDGLWGTCSIAPIAEVCNGIDDDCDSSIDEALLVTCFDDPDDDGYAVSGASMSSVCPTGGRAAVGGCPIGFTNRTPEAPNLDCDGSTSSTHPGATETCNGVDDDCDGTADEGLPLRVRFIDSDGDGAQGTAVSRCEGDPNSVPFSLDCNESDTSVYVGAPELCDRVDNNCSLGGGAAGGVDVFEDQDNDHYSPPDATCSGGPFPKTDCDDTRPTDNPGATELCSGHDTDCDGTIDEDPAAYASCTAPHASAGCAMDGACGIFACDRGYGDCNGDYADGCEVDLSADSANCGACGYSCGGEAPCHPTTAVSAADTHPNGLCDSTVELVAGYAQTCLRFGNAGPTLAGALSCTGNDDWGQAGSTGTTRTRRTTPVAVSAASGSSNQRLLQVVSMDQGLSHACAARRDGSVVCWGRGQEGQLGDGGPTPDWTPFPLTVSGLGGSAVEIGTGRTFTCARLASGQVQCWGDNAHGQLGDGASHTICATTSADCAFNPVTVSGITDAVAIDVYEAHACAVLASGAVKCWGQDFTGVLGDGGSADAPTPVSVTGVSTAVDVATGIDHSCALLADGSVSCWGRNSAGQLGQGSTDGSIHFATPVPGLSAVTSLATGDWFSCVVNDATVFCWGANGSGQIGDGTTTTRPSPTDLTDSVNASAVVNIADQVVAGSNYACARAGQHVQCWGANDNGQFGDGTTSSQNAPSDVPGLMRAAEASGRGGWACGRTTSGALACWGGGSSNTLGPDGPTNSSGQPISSNVPVPMPDLVAVDVVIDSAQGFAVEPGGTVRQWGALWSSSAGGYQATATPTPISGESGVVAAAGMYLDEACFIHLDGTLSCMGTHVGDGTSTHYHSPVPVPGLADVRHVAVSRSHTCAVLGNGHAYCWGWNAYGQVGNGTTTPYTAVSPTEIVFYRDIVDVRVGHGFTCVLRATGEMACWGNLQAGVSVTPVPVTGLPAGRIVDFDAVDSGSICALVDVPPPTPSRPLLCWNSANPDGEMGVGTQTPVMVPTEVHDYTDFDSVMTANNFTCAARDAHRSLTCWGYGGSLGDGTNTLSTVPVTVVHFP